MAADAVAATTVQTLPNDTWARINWWQANREVERLQRRIFRASQQEQWPKVRSLQKLLLRSRSNLILSVRQVTQVAKGKKTPGVDGRVALDGVSRMALVRELQQTPMTRPAPVKRVYIPKANGKQRPLGIPTIADRTRQHHFEANSYGFRPGRSAHDAIVVLWHRLNKRARGKWVLDADIRGAFDHISHAFIVQRLGNFPARQQVRAWLTAGYVEFGKVHETTEGTPQGGVVSPLLANIALDGLQQLLWDLSRQRKWHKPSAPCSFGFARYADDYVVTAPDRGRLEMVLPEIRAWLAVRGLELNEDKTCIVNAYDGFNFLGFTIRKYAKGKCLVTPQKDKVLDKLREWKHWLRQHPTTKPADVIKYLNHQVGQWANYYQHVTSSRVYSYVNNRLFKMLQSWCYRRHPKKPRWWISERYFGRQDGRYWVFKGDTTDRRGRRTTLYLAKAFRPHSEHVLVRGMASPMDPALQSYWKTRRRANGQAAYPQAATKRRLGDRQHWQCLVCGRDLLNGEPVDMHHQVRVADNGTDHLSNLELRHEACHYNAEAQDSLSCA